MQVGRYDVGWHNLASAARMVKDAGRVRGRGVPRVPGNDAAEVARAVLRGNAGAVLSAGAGHFRSMWAVDACVAYGGALAAGALPRDDLARWLGRMLGDGAARGHVPTCFTPRSSYDSPWRRADNVPWLLHAADLVGEHPAIRRADLEKVYADWLDAHVDARTGLVRADVTGDWMDTVPRPSSTYNCLLAVRAYAVARKLGLDAPEHGSEAERALLERRWTGTHLTDHAGAGDYVSADANAPALYFGILPERVRLRAARALDESGLDRPVPMRTRVGAYDRASLPWVARRLPDYHSVAWLHLGLLHLVGRARHGLDVAEGKAAVERTVAEHGNFLETFGLDGRPMRSRWIATEYGFTMSAGLYLELDALVAGQ